MKVAYLAKPERDRSGAITGYEIKHSFSSKILNRPRGDYEILYGDGVYIFKKAELVDGEWMVVEDSKKKLAFKAPRERIREATTLAQLKAVLVDLFP